MKYVLIGLLKLYRLVVSPLYGNVCRYHPSCSAYALRAVSVHGAVKGSWLAGRRLLRCHPWAPGGYDPVPGTPEFAEEEGVRASQAWTLETEHDPAGSDGASTGASSTSTTRHEPQAHGGPNHDVDMASQRGVN
jgi:putative membrane protein insertion efficiency factor